MWIINNYNHFEPFAPAYKPSQRFDGGTSAALIASSLIGGGSQIGGAAMAGGSSPSVFSTFSRNQKGMDRLLFDWLMGITRDGKGKEISRAPLLSKIQQKLKNRPATPVAGLTDQQQQTIAGAGQTLGRAMNLRGVDQNFQQDLKNRFLPAMAGGGRIPPGGSAVVGENQLPEIVHALPGGGVEVIPNPETFKSPESIAHAMASKQAAEQATGVPGKVTGTIFDDPIGTRFQLDTDTGSHFLRPGDIPTFDIRTGLGFQTGSSFSDGNEFLSNDAFRPFQQGFEQSDEFNKFVNSQRDNPFGAFKGLNTNRTGQARRYFDAFGRYVRGLPVATGAPQAITDAMGNIGGFGQPDFSLDAFNNFLTGGTNSTVGGPFGGGAEAFTLGLDPVTGQVRIKDPFASADVFQNIINEYNATLPVQGTTALGGGPQVPGAEDPLDGGAVVGTTDAGGQTTTQEVPADDPSLGTQTTVGTGDGTNGTVDPLGDGDGADPNDPNTNDTAGLPDQSDPAIPGTEANILWLQEQLATFLNPFDSTAAEAAFTSSVEDPAFETFDEKTRPRIRQAFAGNENFFGGGRTQTEVDALEDLTDKLEESRTEFLFNAEEAHKNRGIAAARLQMDLTELPGKLDTTEASINRINALTASTWSTIDINSALADAQITNTQANIYSTLMGIFNMEQNQQQREFEAEFLDLLEVDGFSIGGLMDLLFKYQDQGQIALGV